MNTASLRQRAAAALLTCTLASCGGGGSGDPGVPAAPAPAPSPGTPASAPSPLPVPAPVPTPVVSTGSYAYSTVSFQDFDKLAEINRQGQEGFGILRYWQINTRGVSVDAYLFSKESSDTKSRLSSKFIKRPAPAAMLDTMNAQGALGFAYKSTVRYAFDDGADPSGVVFTTDVSGTDTYRYETQPSGSPIARDVFLNQLNVQGARGLKFLGRFAFVADPGVHLYGKPSASTVTYVYAMESGDFLDAADMAQRLNAQGARGWVYKGLFAVDSAQNLVQLYEKSSGQSSAVEYRVETPRAEPESRFNPTGFVFAETAQANDLGAMGYFYLPYATGSRVNGRVFVKNAFENGAPWWEPVR